MKQKANQILVERGPGLLNRPARKIGQKEKASGVASAFVSENKGEGLRVFVAGGSRAGNDPVYVQEAFLLGEKIGQMGYRLDFGLSSRGVMGAVAKGVLSAWVRRGRTVQSPIKGITTKEYLSLYQSDRVIDEISDIIVAKTLEERKKQLLNADFVIFAPGGVGTLDELVYDCVAMQDGFLSFKPFIIFNVNGFFHHLLEFLKEIHLKKFADALPFIVVDDSVEAGIAFDLLAHYYVGKKTREQALKRVEKIIYELPYFIQKCRGHSCVADIIRQNQAIFKKGTRAEKSALKMDIEKAYLNKEIERMYNRLAKSGKDTAVVSDKLTDLKKRSVKKKNGIY